MASPGSTQLSLSPGDFQKSFAGYQCEQAQKTESQLTNNSQQVRETAWLRQGALPERDH